MRKTIKDIRKLKVIGLNAKLPKGYFYLSSWDCEWLRCNKFEIFKKLEIRCYYKCINSNNIGGYLWLGGLD
jgi:hypothetical protein